MTDRPVEHENAATARHVPSRDPVVPRSAAQQVLALQRAAGNSATSRVLARSHVYEVERYTRRPYGVYPLRFEGRPEHLERIDGREARFRDNYVDYNIALATATVHQDSGAITGIDILYLDGRKLHFDSPLDLDLKCEMPGRLARVGYWYEFLMDRQGLIHPLVEGKVRYGAITTENLVHIRSGVQTLAWALRDLRQVFYLGVTFANLIAQSAGMLGTTSPLLAHLRPRNGRLRFPIAVKKGGKGGSRDDRGKPGPPAPQPKEETTSRTSPQPRARGEARLVDESIPGERYFVKDPKSPRFYAEATVSPRGELSISIRTRLETGTRSDLLRGSVQFRRILTFFKGKFTSIKGNWQYGSNLAKFNELTGKGVSPTVAASRTWTGQQAAAAGYKRVSVQHLQGEPGKYTSVQVLFHE